MMNNLEKQHLIRSENLSEAHYFRSFLQEACRLDLLTNSELEDIEMQSLKLLSKQTERYTFGDSSSVKVETAQGILDSIFYSIGIYLKSFHDTDMSLDELKKNTLPELYQRGRKLIETKFIEARQMLDLIQKDCLRTDNCAYKDTVQDGLGIFFNEYDADYAAQDSPGSVDYPLSNDKMNLTGIEYMFDYLQKLAIENEFCKNFSEQNITNLLLGYNDNYQDLLINIFELVLTNSIGLIILSKNVLKMDITPPDAKKLELKLRNLSKDQLNAILQKAAKKLISELNISNRLLQNHIKESLINISARIKNGLAIDKLDSVFINFKEKSFESDLILEEGQKMEDELFRKITDEIRDCRYVSDKAAIIRREIHSISDLTDVFEADCIFNEEFDQIFRFFSNMELAIITKKLPAHFIASGFQLTESEKEWQNRFIYFLDGIDKDKKERIKTLAEKINLR